MTETSAQAIEIGAAERAPADEMDVGFLRRGDGKLSIVGLGGSAGGIAALQEFFAAMPVDSGLAFVVILHLSPHHESTLAEMFQRSTAMPVVAATDGASVEANSVYVIPPGKFLASANGHLRLTDAEEHRGRRVAVDYFFRTLAETHGAHSLAVVLSGAGGDGALGLKRIKELGGLTIAQDPDEAEHPDMPRSAIATGVVDWVLGVKEMPAKLLAYVKQRVELKLPGEDGPHPAESVELSPDEHEAALRDVLAFLHTRTGRDFSCYKRATILRRLARRMRVNGLADLPSYLVYIRTHAGEAGALLQDLLISVTNFFRDPTSFVALERTIPELFKGKGPGDTVRVWVAGCATGEEAYSIAILLCEHAATLIGPPQIQIFATDLDEEVIREAREGLYPETIAADVSEERLQHFFIHEIGGYRIRRTVRELVLFAPHDLLKDSPFSRLDLLSCRNLLIYLKREAQSRAFDIFHFALRPGGRLFLGTSEAVDEGSALFAVLDKKQRLYTQRPGPQRLIPMPAGPSTVARALALQERTRERPSIPGHVTVESVQASLDQAVPFDCGLPPGELHYRLIERFSPPSILVNSAHEIVHLSESAGRLLQFAGGEPTRNLLRTVHPMLRVELRAALYAAAQTSTVATARRVPVETGDARSLVDIRVTPAGDLAPNFLLVVFEEHPADETAAVAAPRSADADQAALHLERELVATKAHLRETIEESEASTEELKASNEELQAINEELRSATEELETSREELQSINEELRTVNDELKSNVDQLARSNNDLQNLMAATDIATVFLDRELRIQRFTPSAKTLFNFIPADIGRPLSDLSRQLDYPQFVADAKRSLALLQPAQREVNAGERWYIARTVPYRTADDHIAGVVLTFLDITTQKQAEQRLVESEARYRAIGESIDYGVWVCDATGRNTYASESFLRMVGITQQQCSDFGWGEVLHPDDAEATIAAWKECVRTKGRWDRVHRFKGVDGQWHHVLARGVPLGDATGGVHGWAGLNIDITRMMDAEQEVVRIAAESQRQRRLYETVLTNTPDFVYVFSLDHKVVYANDALIKMWGRGHEGAIGKTFLQIGYEPWHAAMHEREIDQVRATRQPIRGEVPFNGTNGLRQYDYIFVPVIGADGEVEAVAGTTRDVTERKESERQLRDGQEQLDFALAAADLGHWSLNLADRTARRTLRHDQIFGYDALLPEWTYDMFLEHVVPQDRAAVDAGFQESLASGSAWAVDCRIRRADGAVRHIWTKALVRRDAGGEVEWMLGIVGDVTDRRQAEERQAFLVRLADTLRPLSDPIDVQAEASRLLGELLGANRVVYFEIRGDEYVIERDHTAGVQPLAGRYPVASFGPALLAVLLAGRTVIEADATTEPDRPPSERAAFAAIQVLGHVDVPLVKNGQFVAGMTVQVCERRDWTRLEVALIEDTAERTWAAVERVRAEVALRTSEERLRMALNAARMVAWEYDPASGAVLTSDNATEVYGFPSGEGMENIDRGFAILHPDDVNRHRTAVAAAVAAGEGFTSQFRIIRPDTGAVQWMEERGHAVCDGPGNTVRLVGINMDITARKEAEAATRESEARHSFTVALADAIRPLSDPVDVQAEAGRVLGERLGANRVAYFEVRGKDYVVERDYTHAARSIVGCYPIASFGPELLALYRAGRTATEADVDALGPRTPSEKEAFAAIQIRSYIGVPLVKGGVLVAGLAVHSASVRTWTPTEIAMAEDTAERTWAAVDRVRTEAALRASEESRWLALDAAELGTFNIDPTTNDLTSDARFRTICAGSSEPMDYEQAFAAVHPDDRERIREAVAAATCIDDPAGYAEEYRVVHPDGSVRWVFAKGRANFAGQGPARRRVSFDGTISDITARKEAEMRVLESEQRFRLVADAAPVMIWLSGTDKLVYWYNQPWLDFTGRSMEVEVGNGAVELVHPDDVDRYLQTYTSAFDSRTPFSMEYRLRRHDGEFRWLSCKGVPRYRTDGEFEGYIGSGLDVTDYKNAEAALREADRRKDEFLATLAHELRNPLAPIRNGLQVIRMAGAQGTVEQARSMMDRQLVQMTRLVDDLLDVSRVSTGKLELRRERLDLRTVVTAALETSRPVIEQHGQDLSVVVPDEPIFVDGDAIRLAQVVSNLLTNAAKYTHRGGHLRVSVARDGATAVLAVADDGIGIPRHMLQTVFGMFTQVDRTLEKTTGGLGIGLSLAKGLVEMHGGTIEAFSEGEGRGSEFAVRLPFATSAVSESEPSEAEAERVELTVTRRILIVDDNLDAADSLGELLRMMGNEVLTAYDGESGIQAAKAFQPGVLLCDIGMPKMNGYDTARSIRAEAWGKNTVLVALTGWGQEEDLRRSAEAGFDHHMVKPIDVDALMALLAGLQPRAA